MANELKKVLYLEDDPFISEVAVHGVWKSSRTLTCFIATAAPRRT